MIGDRTAISTISDAASVQIQDQRRAFFETAAPQLPQDEGFFSMLSKAFLMLRSARRARLEARTAAMQPIY
jgi:hypothetical protein